MSLNTAAGDVASPHHILVVEDEPQMRNMLTDNLEFEGYRVTSVESGEDALREWQGHVFSLLILDLMLPGMSGFDVCRELRIRGSHAPIIILTARPELDRVRSLELGADDCVSKPFSVRELLARVKAQVRRDSWHSSAGEQEFSFGDVTVKLRQRLVLKKGRRIAMSAREFELLRYFFAHRNEVVSREQLLRDVWGYHEFALTRTVDNYIVKLRVLLEPRPHEPRYIVTVHGCGYQLLV